MFRKFFSSHSLSMAVSLVTIWGLSTVSRTALAGGGCPPGLSGDVRSVVLYSPGPGIDKIQTFMPAHLKFLEEAMKSKGLLSAGPFLTNGKPNGTAMAVFSADPEATRKAAEQDPFATHKVVKYEIRSWVDCRLVR